MDTSLFLKKLQSQVDFPLTDFYEFIQLYTPLYIDKNKFVFKSGEVPEIVVFVLKGCLRQYFYSPDGNEQIIHFAEEGGVAGDLTNMRDRKPTGQNLQALEKSEVLAINKTNWEHAYHNFKWFAEFHTQCQQRWVANLQYQVNRSRLDSAETKYLSLMKEHPSLLQRVPQYYIANYLGISPETLSRVRKKITPSLIS